MPRIVLVCSIPLLALVAGCSAAAGQDTTAGSSEGSAVTAAVTAAPALGDLRAGQNALEKPHDGDNVVLRFDSAVLQAVRDTRSGPTVTSRALAVVHTAIYDAWSAYDGRAVGTRLGDQLRRPLRERTDGNRARAIAYAGYRALVDLYPTETSVFAALMTSLEYDPADVSTDPSTPAGVGNAAAGALLAFRHRDGSNQLGDRHPGPYSDYTGYTPVNGPDHVVDPDRWQPLRVPDGHGGTVVQTFLTPHWGRVVPFALRSSDQVEPPRHLLPGRFPGRTYVDQSEDLLDLSAGLTDRQKIVAEYWANGPDFEQPAGTFALFGQFVSRRDHHSISEDAKMFFALTNAMLDAGIAAWDAKVDQDAERPITALRYLFAGKAVRAWAGPGKGTQVIDGGAWTPYLPTPPFAEWYSGHSVFSTAGAEVLRLYTGSDRFGDDYVSPVGASFIEPGVTPREPVTLRWETFFDAADESGQSRRYGGIHFENGDLAGRDVGPRVARLAWARARTYFGEAGRDDCGDGHRDD